MVDRRLNYGRHLIEEFARRVAPVSTALDVGAGEGADLKLVRLSSPGARLHAVENLPSNCRALEAEGIVAHGLDLERDTLPFPDEGLDLVVTNQTLEHTKEIFWILHEISRVLEVGGHLIVGVPNLASLHNRLLLAAGRQPSVIKTASAHVRGFTHRDLLAFLEECFPAGYRQRAFGGSNFYPFPSSVARPLARRLPSLAWGIFVLLEKVRPYRREFLDFPPAVPLETSFYLGPPAP